MKKTSSPLDLDLSYNSAPWPKPKDVLFREDTDWSDNAFLNLGGKAWGAYATGYKEAADVLVHQFLEDWRGKDKLTYPIVFLYRHHIELRLKQLIINGQALLHKPVDFEDEHNLVKLWDPCRKILREIWPQEPIATWNNVERLLKEFHKIDSCGMCFRYPVTTKKTGRQPTLPNLNRVGIRHLHEVMQRLASFFEAHLDGVDFFRREDSNFEP
jgi:hypothetical protein